MRAQRTKLAYIYIYFSSISKVNTHTHPYTRTHCAKNQTKATSRTNMANNNTTIQKTARGIAIHREPTQLFHIRWF